MNKALRRTLTVISILLVVFFAAGLFVGNFFYNLAINPYTDKTAVVESEQNEFSIDLTAYNEGRDWFWDTEYTSVFMESYDGLTLHAYSLVHPESRKWVVINHGYLGHASQLAYAAKEFYDMGYSVLMPDARGHGNSGGDYAGMGWHDRLDLLDWSGYLNQAYGEGIQLVWYGVSMGATTVLMASGEDTPQNLVAIVEDCAYSSVFDEFSYQLKSLFGLPAFPVMHFASLVTRVRAGFWFGEGDALDQMANNFTPTYFIHGKEDTFVPADMMLQLYAACPAEKDMLLVSGAGHGESSSVLGAAYWQAIEGFLERHVDKITAV